MADAAGRQEFILGLLQEQGSVRVSALAEVLEVSTMTIRRDLQHLADEGLVTIIHGGARLVRSSLFEYDQARIEARFTREKEAIGRRCAEMISDGMAIYIDAGTTANCIARAIAHRQNITVITGSLRALNTLAASDGIDLIGAPGTFRTTAVANIGPMADAFTTQFYYDVAFLSGNGIDLDHGFSVGGPTDAASKRCLIGHAAKVVAVLDHSKFDSKSFTRICTLDELDAVVTDDGIDPELLEEYRNAGVNVQVARIEHPDA